MTDEKLLKNEEKAVFALRALYRRFGYMPFCMSKFEEYDLYAENKDFLLGDSVITFNDTDGRLLALKPDVTLSIIKNTADAVGVKERVYYNENVYRVSAKTHRYKEIMQTGLECIGDIDILDVHEVLCLAAMSLATVSDDFVLDISHMGILSSVIDSITDSLGFKRRITRLISERNCHEAAALCAEYSLSSSDTDIILSFTDMYGEVDDVLARLVPICEGRAWDEYLELRELCRLLSEEEFYGRLRLDFSVVNDMNYYSGILFRGFLPGIYEGVLAGGEYGALMHRMGRRGSAIGFALYLDLLEELESASRDHDVDVLLIYDEKVDTGALISKKAELVAEGKSVSLQRAIPPRVRYREIIKM